MKMFKRIIALMTSAVMLMSCSAFAATMSVVESESVMTYDTATVVVDCGTERAGRTVTVTIYEPAANGIGDLVSDTTNVVDPATINAAISYAGQHTVGADGKITITYQPKGPKGKYTMRLGGERIYIQETLEFEYVSPNEAQEIIDELKLDPTTAKVAEIFAKGANENIYAKYQSLGIDAEPLYADYDAIGTEVQGLIHDRIAANLSTVNTPADFITLFEKIAYVEILNAKTGNDLFAFIDAHKDYSGMATVKAYTDIRENPAYFLDAVKTYAIGMIEEAPMAGAEIAATNAVVAEAILTAALSRTSSYGTVDAIISALNAEITAAGGNYAGYAGHSARLEIAIDVIGAQPYANLADFVTKFNGFVTGQPATTPPSDIDVPNTPSGNGGGTGISRPIPSTGNIFTDNGASTPASTVFTDLGGHKWAETAITTLKAKNIVNGKTATEFKPEDTVLREEFAKMIMLTVLSSKVGSATDTSFGDVDSKAWYAPYIAAATKNGVIGGYSETEFGIGDTIRREDMAVMCYRAIKAAGITLKAERAGHQFTDAISDYAKEAISEMYAAGLINGYSDTAFNANGTATRAEAAMILYNVAQKYGK